MHRPSLALLASFAFALRPTPAAANGIEVASRAVLFTPPSCVSVPFSDVASNHPFCAWIRQAAEDGVVESCEGGRYCPDDPLTRAQMSRLLERAMRGTATWHPERMIFARTLIVNPVQGDDEASGSKLLSVLAGISDSAEDNPYLVWLEPGVYDLGNAELQLKPYVTVQGAHRTAVTIETSRAGWAAVGATGAVLRSVTIDNTGAFSSVLGVDLSPGGQLFDASVTTAGGNSAISVRTPRSLERVSARAGGTASAIAVLVTGAATLSRVSAFTVNGDIQRGIHVDTAATVRIEHSSAGVVFAELQGHAIHVEATGSSVVTVHDVVAEARNATVDSPFLSGLHVTDGTVVVEDSRLAAEATPGGAYGVSCSDAAANTIVRVHNSRLIGPTATVFAPDADCTVRVGGSQLAGGLVDDGGGVGDIACVASYAETFVSFGINDCL